MTSFRLRVKSFLFLKFPSLAKSLFVYTSVAPMHYTLDK